MTTKRMTPAARKARNGRIAALTVFLTGAAASLAANLMASDGTAVGMVVGAFPAVMLLGSLYLLENGETHPRWVRWTIVPVIVVAAWMSYWHVVEVVAEHEGTVTAHLFAIIIDLPMAIASAALRPAPVRRTTARKRPAAKKAETKARTLKAV